MPKVTCRVLKWVSHDISLAYGSWHNKVEVNLEVFAKRAAKQLARKAITVLLW